MIFSTMEISLDPEKSVPIKHLSIKYFPPSMTSTDAPIRKHFDEDLTFQTNESIKKNDATEDKKRHAIGIYKISPIEALIHLETQEFAIEKEPQEAQQESLKAISDQKNELGPLINCISEKNEILQHVIETLECSKSETNERITNCQYNEFQCLQDLKVIVIEKEKLMLLNALISKSKEQYSILKELRNGDGTDQDKIVVSEAIEIEETAKKEMETLVKREGDVRKKFENLVNLRLDLVKAQVMVTNLEKYKTS
ncbi:MAG: hypothetical protein JSR46_08865 [Verrucomicrobia bacterium]|nr:hypothetical protein [Verrucomicrobiota bacterium]